MDCGDRSGTYWCDVVTYTTWCWQPDYTDSPPDPGSGAGGGGGDPGADYASDHVNSTDLDLKFKVMQGLKKANDRLQNTACSMDLLGSMTAAGGRMNAFQMLIVDEIPRGLSGTADWLDNGIVFQSGAGVLDANRIEVCAAGTAAAWTTPGSTTVYVCSAFKSLGSSLNCNTDVRWIVVGKRELVEHFEG